MQQGGTHQKGLRCAGWTASQNSSRLCREEDSSFACLWGTLQDRNALVCYLQNKPQSGFLLKGSFILGLEEKRKEKKKESRKSREKTRIRGSVLSCRSASPRSAALALSCPLLSPLPLQLAELRRCACRACQQGQAVSEDLLLPQHVGEPTESPYRKTRRAVPAFAGIALIPAKTRLKKNLPLR